MLQVGNYLGAAKDAINLAKNKTFRKKVIIQSVISALTPIIIVCFVLGIIMGIGEAILSVVESVGEFFTPVFSNDLEIKITDEALDAMIASVESMGVSLDDLHLMGEKADYNDPDVVEKNKKALRKYFKQFYEAQAVTQTLYPSPTLLQNIGDKIYGTVYVQRVAKDDKNLSKVNRLRYIPYDSMVSTISDSSNETVNLNNFLFIGDSRTAGIKSKLEELGENIGVAVASSSRPSDWKNISSTGGTDIISGSAVTLVPSSKVKGVSVALGVNGASYQIDSMKETLNNLLSLYPDVPIFVNEVVKVGKEYKLGNITASETNTSINTFNSELKNYCNTNSRLVYINVSSDLYDSEGYLKSEYTSDSINLNSAGNEVLVKNIQNAILKSGSTQVNNELKTDIITDLAIEELMKCFSINPNNGKLVVPNTTTTTIIKGTYGKIGTRDEKTSIGLTEIDYKSVISQYTTSMNFLVYLTVITQNPEFAAAVADLIKDSDIRITLMDKVTTNITKEERNYDFNSKTKVRNKTEYRDPVEKTESKTTTVVTTIPIPAVNYAKTWFCEQTIEYIKEDIPIPESSYDTGEPKNEPEPPIGPSAGTTVSWITNDVTTITTSGNIKQYKESNRGDVIDRLGEIGDGNKSFIGLLDVKFKIPNRTRGEALKESAGGNLVSGAEMFFALLQKDSTSQNLENIMRYALYKYTKNNYGVTSFDFSIFDAEEFSTVDEITGSTAEDKVWYSLKALGFSDEAVAGAMGNISRESGFSPTNLNSSSGAYGLAQWKGDRKTKLENYARSKGKTIDDIDIQIEFLIAELTGKGDAAGYATRRTRGGAGENYHTYDDWANATTVDDAAVAYCWFFETPSTSKTRTPETIASENRRKAEAQRYYKMYTNRGLGGDYQFGSTGEDKPGGVSQSASGEYGVRCYYTSSKGRKFKVLNQSAIEGWGKKCNKAACAIIASGYSNETSSELIKSRDKAHGLIPANGSAYWNKYGLQIRYIEKETKDYVSQLRNHMLSGGYAMIRIYNQDQNGNDQPYYGKSGFKWTETCHWISILDYKRENGVEKMCVAERRGVRWVGFDEFTTYGITHLVLVSEDPKIYHGTQSVETQ